VQEPPLPPDEQERLAALRALEILDTPAEERFDRITRVAARLFAAPIVLVSLVDSERQWFKSCIGLRVDETPRGVSFCAHAIAQDQAFLVPDAHVDERFADNPLVTGDPFIRSYAGQPLHEPGGRRVGTLCVIDRRPRTFTEDDLQLLRDLAAWAELELGSTELQRALAAEVESERRMRSVLSSVADAVATFDATGTIESVNPAAELMFGWPSEAFVGKSVLDIVDPPDHPIVLARLAARAAAEVGELVRIAVRGLRADGSTFPMEVAVGEVEGHEGELFIAVGVDRTEVDAAHRRTESILDSAGDGIIGIDRHGVVTFANHAALEMLAIPAADLVGSPFHERVQHTRFDGTRYPWELSPVHATLHGGSAVREYDEVFWRPDGTWFEAEYTTTPLAEGRTVVGAVVTFRDVTERRMIDRMKDEFVSVVSHELRTPLTSIRGSLGLLAGGVYGKLSDEAQSMLDVAVANSERLVRLVNDILDLERLASGQAQLDVTEIDLREVADAAAAAMHGAAVAAGVDLDVRGAPVRLLADRHRLAQVLDNLIGNAVKFSPAGGHVEVEVEEDGTHGVISVCDHGRGIPPDQLERIFDRFQQVDASDAREKGGTGLGLAIAKGIVDQHGGTLSVTSELGVGTTFRVALPR
jgi:PAS domain S-box-containing protein